MPNAEALQYITIDDFSPGIVQRVNSGVLTGAAPGQIGAARADGTFRCVALPNGGLGPLPKRYYDYEHAAISADTKTMAGFHLMGPLTTIEEDNPDLDEQDPDLHQVALFIAYGYTTGGTKHEVIETLNLYKDTTLILQDSSGGALNGRYAPVFMTPHVSNNDTGKIITFNWQRIADSGATDLCQLFYPYHDGGGPSTPTSPYTQEFENVFSNPDEIAGIQTAHQGRIVVASLLIQLWADRADNLNTPENLYFTDPLTTLNKTGSNVLRLGEEAPYGVALLASLTASDLLVIKQKGGGYLVQGDLIYPTVRHLPGITSPGGTWCEGVNSSIGFLYGVNNGGVRLWTGGEGSDQLAPQLDPSFWIAESLSALQHYKGKFNQWNDYILVPNNWLFDTVTKGWWRLEDPDEMVYFSYEPSPFNNVLYAARTTFSDAEPICVSGWDGKTPASSYSWAGQPLPIAMERRVTAREVGLFCQGEGTITLTFSGSDASDRVVTFEIPSGYSEQPIFLRQRFSWEGLHLSVQIESEHTNTGPAPIVRALRIGYYEGPQVPETGVVS